MTRKILRFMLRFTAFLIFVILIMQPLSIFLFQENIVMLFPKGMIAILERDLLFVIQALMLLVITPVYILTFIFSWKYNAYNPHGKYDPDLVDNKLAEVIWWGFPAIITLIICILTWVKTHELDPFKPLVSDKPTKTIQVVALQWKWLFIYPEEKIATVNFLQIPEQTPIHFEITADAPMNSFWIPDLGGQIYAMPRMKSQLNLIANEVGDFRGASANISGEGFASMHFITRASSEEDFKQWIQYAKQASRVLNEETYNLLSKPSIETAETIYQLADEGLFNQIMMKYMHPQE